MLAMLVGSAYIALAGTTATPAEKVQSPLRELPPLLRAVSNEPGVLSLADGQALSQRIAEIERDIAVKMVALEVVTVAPESIEAYAQRLINHWKGQSRALDNGRFVFIVIAKSDWEIRVVPEAEQDRVRDGACETTTRLRALGLRTAMLTGDNARAAHAIARALGLDDVQQLQKQYDTVLMVGDGVNDAAARAAATCGIAMGTAGTDAAIEAADVALMADNIAKVEEALALGCKARRISAQNIVFSLLLLAVMIPLAVFCRADRHRIVQAERFDMHQSEVSRVA